MNTAQPADDAAVLFDSSKIPTALVVHFNCTAPGRGLMLNAGLVGIPETTATVAVDSIAS